MTALPLRFWSYYLTQPGQWRQEDWNTRALVCGAKQEPFKGELRLTVDQVPRVFRNDNIDEFVTWVMGKMGGAFRSDIAAPVSFVPIPNSTVAVGSCVTGRTHALAELVAAEGAAQVSHSWDGDEDRFVAWVTVHPAPRAEWLKIVEGLKRRRSIAEALKIEHQ